MTWLETLAEKRDKIRVKANKKIRERNALETQLAILKMEIAD